MVRDEGPNQVDAVPPGDLPDEGLFSSDELLGSGEITNVSEGSAAGVFHCAGGHVGRSPVVCPGGIPVQGGGSESVAAINTDKFDKLVRWPE